MYSDYENNRVLFSIPYYPVRFRNNCYNKKLLTLENKYLGIDLEKNDIPFFLILNSDLKIESIHIVNKVDFLKTEKYLYNARSLVFH